MDRMFGHHPWTVGELVSGVDKGGVRLPDIQRPFVWPNAKVRDLVDSMYRGYPVGELMFWANRDPAHTRSIGSDTKTQDASFQVVDGQQRLTSLYAVVKGLQVWREDYSRERVTIAFNPLTGRFEVPTPIIRKSVEWIPDIKTVFDDPINARYDYLTRLRTDEARTVDADTERTVEVAITRLNQLLRYDFQVVQVKDDVDREVVADIFVRINSEGVNLSSADFILTWLSVFWEEGRSQLEEWARNSRFTPTEITHLTRETDPSAKKCTWTPNNPYLAFHPGQILRVVIAVGLNRARLGDAYNALRGRDPRTRMIHPDRRDAELAKLKAGQAQALNPLHWDEFLKVLERAGFRNKSMITSTSTILYTYALWLIGRNRFKVPVDELREVMARWFFMSQVTGRYTSSPETRMQEELNRLDGLPENAAEFTKVLTAQIDAAVPADWWTVTLPDALDTSSAKSPAWVAYVAALNILDADVLLATSKVKDWINPNRTTVKGIEKHHLFPKAYLKKHLGLRSVRKINQVANFALVEWSDNIAISDTAPATYWPAEVADKTHRRGPPPPPRTLARAARKLGEPRLRRVPAPAPPPHRRRHLPSMATAHRPQLRTGPDPTRYRHRRRSEPVAAAYLGEPGHQLAGFRPAPCSNPSTTPAKPSPRSPRTATSPSVTTPAKPSTSLPAKTTPTSNPAGSTGARSSTVRTSRCCWPTCGSAPPKQASPPPTRPRALTRVVGHNRSRFDPDLHAAANPLESGITRRVRPSRYVQYQRTIRTRPGGPVRHDLPQRPSPHRRPEVLPRMRRPRQPRPGPGRGHPRRTCGRADSGGGAHCRNPGPPRSPRSTRSLRQARWPDRPGHPHPTPTHHRPHHHRGGHPARRRHLQRRRSHGRRRQPEGQPGPSTARRQQPPTPHPAGTVRDRHQRLPRPSRRCPTSRRRHVPVRPLRQHRSAYTSPAPPLHQLRNRRVPTRQGQGVPGSRGPRRRLLQPVRTQQRLLANIRGPGRTAAECPTRRRAREVTCARRCGRPAWNAWATRDVGVSATDDADDIVPGDRSSAPMSSPRSPEKSTDGAPPSATNERRSRTTGDPAGEPLDGPWPDESVTVDGQRVDAAVVMSPGHQSNGGTAATRSDLRGELPPVPSREGAPGRHSLTPIRAGTRIRVPVPLRRDTMASRTRRSGQATAGQSYGLKPRRSRLLRLQANPGRDASVS